MYIRDGEVEFEGKLYYCVHIYQCDILLHICDILLHNLQGILFDLGASYIDKLWNK